jgi:hypothetical protein
MMEIVDMSETSVCFNETTLRYIPESCDPQNMDVYPFDSSFEVD